MLAKRRLRREVIQMENDPPENCYASPSEESIFFWYATIIGPADSPFEGGVFKLTLQFCQDYPFKPPIVRFVTKMFHPNINSRGRICLDVLKENWNPVLTIGKLLLSITSFLVDPNPEDPLVAEVARYDFIEICLRKIFDWIFDSNLFSFRLFKENKEEYVKRAKEYTEKYATE